ncbi:uncharacterized protein LOC117337490 [Pecten maximus]|uniref:uncharacterized protein LOC117337490 n=1 Tax=Pecten maximus TaxID=6579 RepID=UPI001458420C|nr:uncharacterized protein LOC117337490 [Pecten maximus]
MKITVIHPDLKRSQIRFSERKTTKVSALFKHLPPDATIKGLGKKVDVGKDCFLNEIFTHGDVIEAVYTAGSRVRRLSRRVKVSSDPCMITLDTTDQRVEMPCGHSITPQALFDYCWHELEKGSSKITCPYVTDLKGDRCGYRWRSYVIIQNAAMTRTEKMLFRKRLDINRIKQQELESSNVLPDDVIISHLHNSPKLPHYGNVLKRRACPKCWSIIEHVSGCLTMTCQYPSCNFKFCFRCLGEYSNEYNHSKCLVAPLQFLDTNIKLC